MGFFYSPMKLVALLKSSSAIANATKINGATWYMSAAGKDAYQKATTPAQKTMFFFEYLTAISSDAKNREVLHKIAYVIAYAVEGSSLAYGSFPDILDPDKNPLVGYVKTHKLTATDHTVYGLTLLAALHGEKEANRYLKEEYKPYARLTYCEADGKVGDLYRVERAIISAFCTGFKGQYMPPYMYEIVESANAENEEGSKNA